MRPRARCVQPLLLLLTTLSASLPLADAFPHRVTRNRPPAVHSAFSNAYGATRTQSAVRRSTALPSSLLGSAPLFDNPSNGFFLTRIVFLRALAFVYAVAFLVARDQNRGLIGDHGIAPARNVLDAAQRRGQNARLTRQEYMKKSYAGRPKLPEPNVAFDDGGNVVSTPQLQIARKIPKTVRRTVPNPIDAFLNTRLVRAIGMSLNRNDFVQHWRERLWDRADALGRPVVSLLWLAPDRNNLNPWLDLVAICGLVLSMIVFTLGAANVPILFAMWLCQRSLMSVGGPFYGFGWEPQLAELGFHAMFLVPLFTLQPIPAMAPPPIVLWTIRWHLFRVMIGAGLIKLRSGDPKWRMSKLSAMDYFYETQPVPNPLTRYMHWAPKVWHRFEVLSNHFVELVAPWLLLSTSTNIPFLRRFGGIVQLVFQVILISTGNLSFLNWLTCVPAILCLDDQIMCRIFPYRLRNLASLAAVNVQSTPVRKFVSLTFGVLVMTLSIPVIQNLCSKNQVMNASFDPLRLVNTYGAFGTVEEERHELVVSAASSIDGPWKEYEFRVKPGDVYRSPKFISPYHYRLDWQMWVACHTTMDRSPWLYTFLLKLLQREPDVTALLEKDPFESEDEGPKYIRVDRYRYTFHRKGGDSTQNSSVDKERHGTSTGSERTDSVGNGVVVNMVQNGEKEKRKSSPYWDREHLSRVFPKQGVATELILEDIIARTRR